MFADTQFNNIIFQTKKFTLVVGIKITYQTLMDNISIFLPSDACDSEQTVCDVMRSVVHIME
jgi:hypothetical protein